MLIIAQLIGALTSKSLFKTNVYVKLYSGVVWMFVKKGKSLILVMGALALI